MSSDGATQRLYVDGVRRTSGAAAVPLVNIAMPWTFGGQNCTPCSSTSYTGGVDELAIYDKALTEERITAHVSAAR